MNVLKILSRLAVADTRSAHPKWMVNSAQGTTPVGYDPISGGYCELGFIDYDCYGPQKAEDNLEHCLAVTKFLPHLCTLERTSPGHYHLWLDMSPAVHADMVISRLVEVHRSAPTWVKTNPSMHPCGQFRFLRLPGLHPQGSFWSQIWDGKDFVDIRELSIL